MKRTQRLLDGGVVKPNSAHADLWQVLADLVREGQLPPITLQKVMSHGDLSLAKNGVEHWAFWRNALVDSAVGRFNQMRDQLFWQTWSRVRFELGYYREVHADCLAVLLKVGRYAMAKPADDGDGDGEAQAPPSEARPVGPESGWQLGPQLCCKYLATNMRVLHEWWTSVGAPLLQTGGRLQTPLRWIAGVQLYCDFWLTTKWAGFLSPVHSQWFDDPDAAPPHTARHLGGRTTMWLRAWKAYLKHNGVVVPAGVHRPWSYSVNYWTQCYRLPWSQQRLDRIDDALLALTARPLLKPVQLTRYVLDDLGDVSL